MSKKVLVVDDDENILDVIVIGLEDIGVKCETATSGNKAYEILKEKEFDCIISDIRMDDGTGIDLLKNIKSGTIAKGVPFFFVTGFSDYSEKEVNTLGADAIIFKPFDIEEFVMVIKKKLGL